MAEPKTLKPRVFVGSSSESKPVAERLQRNLVECSNPILWNDAPGFEASRTTIEALEAEIESSDFAVFVFAPDDVTTSRGAQQPATRDNVLFEFGLFLGKLGRTRVFGIACSNPGTPIKVPSDLLGVNLPRYCDMTDEDLLATVREVTSDLAPLIVREGHRERRDISLVCSWKLTKSGRFVLEIDPVRLQANRTCLSKRRLGIVARKQRATPFTLDSEIILGDLFEIPRDNVMFEVVVQDQDFASGSVKPTEVIEAYLMLVPEPLNRDDLMLHHNLERMIRAGCDRLDGVGINGSEAEDD